MITSASNKKIKNVMLLLTKSRERKKQKCFVTEGVKMFLEAPVSWILEIYVSEGFEKEISGQPLPKKDERGILRENGLIQVRQKLSELSGQGEIFVEIVKEELFQKMSDTQTPQGILCVLKIPEYQMNDFVQIPAAQKGLYLILEDIQDPGNLGTMLRFGEGAGMTGVIMSRNTVDIFNPKTIRATMGSIYRVPFLYTDNLEESIGRLRENGIRTYAAHLSGTKAYDREDFREAVAFLIGNEGNGLSERIAELADAYLKIPMLGQVESLNAAIAAALFLYEAARQRRI